MDDKCDLLRGIREEKVPSKAKRGECTRPSGNGVVSFSPPRWREMKTRFPPRAEVEGSLMAAIGQTLFHGRPSLNQSNHLVYFNRGYNVV